MAAVSSLLNAGLITHLKASGDWLVLKTRPSVSPMKSLAKVLVDALYDDPIAQSESTKELTDKLLLQALADVISNKAEFDTLKPFLQETQTVTTE